MCLSPIRAAAGAFSLGVAAPEAIPAVTRKFSGDFRQVDVQCPFPPSQTFEVTDKSHTVCSQCFVFPALPWIVVVTAASTPVPC